MQTFVHAIWYGNGSWHWLLLPLELVFRAGTGFRRLLYRLGLLRAVKVDVPVVVVGNITAGGTGKTPVTLWLAEALKRRGFSPGIASRGYGGSGRGIRVTTDSPAELVGDEPLLLARRSGCPVIVDADRVAAAAALIDAGADVVISDDGLQHYRLHRDFEICVIDSVRGLGNGHCIPAGPLRESRARLDSVDQVLINGPTMPANLGIANAMHFELTALDAVRVNGSGSSPLSNFARTTVNAAAAIGNPQRFFEALRTLGIEPVEHEYADHATITLDKFDPNMPLLITEKDAVKLAPTSPDNVWFVPVTLQMDEPSASRFLDQLVAQLQRRSDV